MPVPMTLRAATVDDVPRILAFIRGLADYERLLHEVVATEDGLRRALFGPRPYAEVVLAEDAGAPVGFALFFHTFSTFLGQPGIYLEDLFVRPAHRGRGIGKALLVNLAQQCEANGWSRLQWSVLDWNTPSIEFYKSLGAELMDEWTVCRVNGPALTALAQGTR